MNQEDLDLFDQSEKMIMKVENEDERRILLNDLFKHRQKVFESCWIKQVARIKSMQASIIDISHTMKTMEEDIKNLSDTITEKAKLYDKHLEEYKTEKIKRNAFFTVFKILKYIVAAGGGAVLLKILQYLPL